MLFDEKDAALFAALAHGQRVAVTGGRDFDDWSLVWEVLDLMAEKGLIEVLMHGVCATGADLFADDWFTEKAGPTIELLRFPANWRPGGVYDPGAGPKRNRRMLVEGQATVLLSFPGGRGTKSCTEIAESLKITVLKPRRFPG